MSRRARQSTLAGWRLAGVPVRGRFGSSNGLRTCVCVCIRVDVDRPLPPLDVGARVPVVHVTMAEGKTAPPSHLSEAEVRHAEMIDGIQNASRWHHLYACV